MISGVDTPGVFNRIDLFKQKLDSTEAEMITKGWYTLKGN
jgi:hypothetical protein